MGAMGGDGAVAKGDVEKALPAAPQGYFSPLFSAIGHVLKRAGIGQLELEDLLPLLPSEKEGSGRYRPQNARKGR